MKGNCFNCGEAGHFIRDCPSNKPQQNKQRANVIMQEEQSTEDDTVLIINEPASSDKLIIFDGLIDLYPARILIDSGSTNNYISELFVEEHNIYTSPVTDTTHTILANGISLSVKSIAPDVQLHIQDYIDELSVDVIPLTSYDMVLGMAWLEKYGAAIDHTSRTITFAHEGSIVTLQSVPTRNAISTAECETPLITDDQLLILSEGVHEAPSPHHNSSIVNTVLYIILVVILFTAYTVYSCSEHVTVSRVGISTNETQMHTPSTISRLLHPMSYFSNPQTIISIWLCIYPFIHTFTTERTPDHSTIDTSPSSSGHEYIQRKVKKARPR